MNIFEFIFSVGRVGIILSVNIVYVRVIFILDNRKYIYILINLKLVKLMIFWIEKEFNFWIIYINYTFWVFFYLYINNNLMKILNGKK